VKAANSGIFIEINYFQVNKWLSNSL